jgi:hypothetical protein
MHVIRHKRKKQCYHGDHPIPAFMCSYCCSLVNCDLYKRGVATAIKKM